MEVDHVFSVTCKDNVVSDCVDYFELRFVSDVFGYFVRDDARDVHVKEVKE